MSAVNLTDKQEELVRRAATACGFENVEIVANVGSLKGDNYLGIIHTVTVREKNRGDERYFILKSAHTNDFFRKEAPVSNVYKREAYLYDTVIPALVAIQEEKVISDPFTGAAKFYGSCLEEKNEAILMRNLKMYGYRLWDRMQPMNDEHVTLVFSEYGRLHAASLALRRLRPKDFAEITKDIHKGVFDFEDAEEQREKFRMFIKIHFANGLKAVKESPRATEALEKLSGKIEGLMQDLENMDKDKCVVTHGDCWCNNMLFKYQDNEKKPSKVCFIDWQLSRVGSPIMDLSYFFCACCSKVVFPNLNKYLATYHQVLSRNLREFGCDPDENFSLEAVKAEWKRHSWYGVFLALMIIRLMLSDSEEAPDVTQLEGKDFVDSFANFQVSRQAEVESRLRDLIEFMADSDFIQ